MSTVVFPAIIPYTRGVMLSTNNALLAHASSAPAKEDAGEPVETLLQRWSRLALGRSAISALGAGLVAWAMVGYN